jgi:hypothetical protein
MPQSCRFEMGLAPNDGLIRPKYPRAGNTPFKNDFCNKIDPKRTLRTVLRRSAKDSFDHLIGATQQRQRYCQAESLRGLEIDNQCRVATK